MRSTWHSYAVSFGGNAVTAAFCCAKLGIAPDLLTTVADDWLGRMFLDMAVKYGISIHARKVRTSCHSLCQMTASEQSFAVVTMTISTHSYPAPLGLKCASFGWAHFLRGRP
jgi:sugar/nucleoside kinase (ribokinase family)